MSPVSQALYKGYKTDIQQSNDFCHREVQRGLLRLSLIVAMSAIAIAFEIYFLMSLRLWYFSMSTLAFILPSFFFIRSCGHTSVGVKGILALIVFFIGFLACIVGTFVAVNNIILSIKNGDSQSCSA